MSRPVPLEIPLSSSYFVFLLVSLNIARLLISDDRISFYIWCMVFYFFFSSSFFSFRMGWSGLVGKKQKKNPACIHSAWAFYYVNLSLSLSLSLSLFVIYLI